MGRRSFSRLQKRPMPSVRHRAADYGGTAGTATSERCYQSGNNGDDGTCGNTPWRHARPRPPCSPPAHEGVQPVRRVRRRRRRGRGRWQGRRRRGRREVAHVAESIHRGDGAKSGLDADLLQALLVADGLVPTLLIRLEGGLHRVHNAKPVLQVDVHLLDQTGEPAVCAACAIVQVDLREPVAPADNVVHLLGYERHKALQDPPGGIPVSGVDAEGRGPPARLYIGRQCRESKRAIAIRDCSLSNHG
mmetsp:Transcript_1151/g.3614  ORF Transcript_1151/g.3614 Transcript_1151/m.3614 type:complete len:247 (+) Transcript_1151:242-982(+)